MKAAILIESLTGHTWKAGEMIADQLQQMGWGVTSLARSAGHYAALQAADLVLVGTGPRAVRRRPNSLGAGQDRQAAGHERQAGGRLLHVPASLNPGKSLEKITGVLGSLGADVLGGVALHRAKLPQHTEEFVARLVENEGEKVSTRSVSRVSSRGSGSRRRSRPGRPHVAEAPSCRLRSCGPRNR